MTYIVQNFIPEMHHPKVAEWWKGHGWPIVPLRHLPSRGYIVEDLAAGFLYSTDSSAAIMEWVVGNPKAPIRQVYNAIRTIVAHIIQVAEDDGFELVFTALKVKGLVSLYQKEKFMLTDTGMAHMIWRKK